MPVCRTESQQSGLECRLCLAVLEFFVPGHLNGFELAFVGSLRVTGKTWELGDPLVHVRKADGERIGIWVFVRQADSDVFDLVPTKCRRHVGSSVPQWSASLA